MKFRTCLLDPIDEIFDAARLLDAAVSAHFLGDRTTAATLIKLADIPAIRQWSDSLWGAGGPWSKPPLQGANPIRHVSKAERFPSRNPNNQAKKFLIDRDGFHCRFCSIPLIRIETRNALRSAYPDVLNWGSRNVDQHAAFQAMHLQFDHLLPHARGGDNSLENLIVTCAPCNNGRSNLTLEEVGLEDPHTRPKVQSLWDGLERFNSNSKRLI